MADPEATKAKWPDVLYSRDLQEKVASAKVLAVGAGGIGCELLKTLVLSGFRDIHTIDLDTIETSNLNRQFLFRRSHVSQPKAEVAAAAVRAFAPLAPPTPTPADNADNAAAAPDAPPPSVRGERANIKEPRFDVDFFRAFDVVLNGLDNAEARRHVNRLCLAAGVPLVESGTAGYLGQVTVHVRGLSQCYECTPKPPAAKTYPVCTLRNTPDKPVHCVVWAKDLLFAQLFGGPGAVTDLLDGHRHGQAGGGGGAVAEEGAGGGGAEGGEGGAGAAGGAGKEEEEEAAAAAAKAAKARAEAEAEAAERASAFTRREGEASLAYAARVFTHEYGTVVRRLAANTAVWTSAAAAKSGAKPPEPLSLAALLSLPAEEGGAANGDASSSLSPEALAALARALNLPPDGASDGADAAAADADAAITTTTTAATATTTTTTRSAARAVGLSDDHRLWTPSDSARVLLRAAVALLDERPGGVTEAFDKDDDLAVDFVVAAANLRSACFGIAPQTRFAAKGMAGNIVHAIATTNAAVAGLVVVEATKLLAGLAPEACHSTFLNEADRRTGRARAPYRVLLARAALEPPAPGCMACGRAVATLRADVTRLTLERLVSRVLKGHLALNEPTIVSDGGFMYEEGEGLEEDELAANALLLPLALADLPGGGVRGGAVLSVSDQSQGGTKVELVLRHDPTLDELAAPEGFLLEGWVGPAAAAAEKEEEEKAAGGDGGKGKEEAAAAAAGKDDAAKEDEAGAGANKRPRDTAAEDKEEQAAAGAEAAAAAGAAKRPRAEGGGGGDGDDGPIEIMSTDDDAADGDGDDKAIVLSSD